jgi:DNA modification methylase
MWWATGSGSPIIEPKTMVMQRPITAVEEDLDFSSAGHIYATHGLHAFAARCPPPLVDWAITRYTSPGDLVLDPMTGSGTTLVEACLLGRATMGAEIDPLARLLAKAKATPVDPEALDTAGANIARLLGQGALDDSWRPDLLGWDRWFRLDVAQDLSRLRDAIHRDEGGQNLRDLLWVAFSSLIVARTSVANAYDLVHSRHHYRAWETSPDVPRRFADRLKGMRRMMVDYRTRLVDTHGTIDVKVAMVGNDARSLALDAGSVDLVFTSPPYCSALDYTRAHMFAVAWMADVLGIDVGEYRRLGRSYVGSERAPLTEASKEQPLPPALGQASVDEVVHMLRGDNERAWIVYRYFRDMLAVISECVRVVRPGGRVVLVVCPSNIRKVRIATHEIFTDLARQLPGEPVEVEALLERTIHDRRRVMPYLEAAFGERMRTEYVLVLRRKDGG